MHKRDVITFPGPGGSRVSCCIIPCGCIMVLLVSLLIGSVGLFLHSRSQPSRTRQVATSGTPRVDRIEADLPPVSRSRRAISTAAQFRP